MLDLVVLIWIMLIAAHPILIIVPILLLAFVLIIFCLSIDKHTGSSALFD